MASINERCIQNCIKRPNISWSLNVLCDRKCQDSEYTIDTQGSEYACIILNNAQIFLNMSEAEPKITVQTKWHL